MVNRTSKVEKCERKLKNVEIKGKFKLKKVACDH